MGAKVVIFDLDGTLLNTYEDLANAVNYGLTKCGFPARPAENYKKYAGNGTDMMILRALGELASDENLNKVKPLYLEYYNAHTGECTRPYDEIPELLSQLKAKGIKLGVVSNKIDCMTQTVVKEYFGDVFDYVTGQKDGMPTKPDPTGVVDALSKLSATAGQMIFVGDSGVDMQTGKNSGGFSVGVLWGFRDREELLNGGADALISLPNELLRYI